MYHVRIFFSFVENILELYRVNKKNRKSVSNKYTLSPSAVNVLMSVILTALKQSIYYIRT